MNLRFENRREAGVVLAGKLKGYTGWENRVVLGLLRGGIPVAFPIAETLAAPLEPFTVRKLGAPGHEEFAIGAIASGGICFLNEKTVRWLQIPEEYVRAIVRKEQEELKRRESLFRDPSRPLSLKGKTVILVDDGLATGASMKAAVMAVRTQKPEKIVVAVPVGAPDTCSELSREVDDLVCLQKPEPFHSVGEWYEEFGQVSDEEVGALLKQSHSELAYETR